MGDITGKVFISYASRDASIAQELCAGLESADIPCWIAPRDVRPGEPYAAAIVQAINSCRTLVLILSKNSIDSPHVVREVERACSKRRPVLSIRMDAADLPAELEYFVSSNHWLDASGGPVKRILPALIESVRGQDASGTPREKLAAASVNKPSLRWRKPALVAALAVLAIVAQPLWGSEPYVLVIALQPAGSLTSDSRSPKQIAPQGGPRRSQALMLYL
jgi:TIR domain-containing protein